ncbi:MAG: alkaline phosphatase [Betaproteobacteria bacterium]|nr:MAG: alkaline phosphatase [Betaproteobacteria bacterium]
MHNFSRRAFLQALAAIAAARASPLLRAQSPVRFVDDPFRLGVASGYPRPDGAVIWTRLAPDITQTNGGLDPVAVPVRWEVARDEKFASIAASGSVDALQQAAHSVHVEPAGLGADRWYWYRFIAGGAASPVGRMRTAPAADAATARLRFAFASCQQYEQGWYSAYRHMQGDDLDLVVFLGDYIYESSWGRDHVRKHDRAEPYTLQDYRARYALYKSDADLQAAHQAYSWILTWDDHEVDNDYANDRPEDGMPAAQFLLRRAAAYQAYYEHMPLPSSMRPVGSGMRIHTSLAWGRLANFHVVDGRQYRDHQVCPSRRGGSNVVDPESCREIRDASRTLLGAEQEAWLDRGFAATRAQWNILAQQTLMARLDRRPGDGQRFWTDGWDGYPAARKRLLESMAARKLANPIVIGGDVHMHYVADLKADFDDEKSPVVASEFCGTSITSQGPSQKSVDALLPENPHIKLARSDHRGYVRASVGGGTFSAELIALDTVKRQESKASVLARFVVEDGRPGPQRS